MEGSDLFSEIRVLPQIWKKVLTTKFCSNLKQQLQNACFHFIQFFFSFFFGGGYLMFSMITTVYQILVEENFN